MENNDAKLKRDIGMLAASFLVLNGIIGAGIFGLPGRLAEVAGTFSPRYSSFLVFLSLQLFGRLQCYPAILAQPVDLSFM